MSNQSLQYTTLETPRLRLVAITPAYCEAIFQAFTKTVARYTFPQPTGNSADTEAFIAHAQGLMEQGNELQVVVLDKETSEFLGCAGLHHLNTPHPELGLWFKENAWGKGYGTETMQALKAFVDEHYTYEYLHYPVVKENNASRNIAEKLRGILQPDGRITKNANGEPLKEVVYWIYS